MTLIVLLILAAVGLSSVFSDKGVFERAENAGAKYNEAKAREVLETVLLADGQYEKNINPDYNQDEFLDELIKSEIPGSDVKGDVAIIGEYAYELDRSVPKIGRYLGKVGDLIFPTIDATVAIASDKKNATITINASENKDGINKIEIWLLGEKIKEYTYNPAKPEVTEPYIATQNGNYIIKAYGDLMASTIATVEGIVASVKFDPNGNNEWKKSHSTTVTIRETADKVVKSKYVWTDSINTPNDDQFPDDQIFKSGDTITKNGLTGSYYLWTMLETLSGERLKWRSEGFNFDNKIPDGYAGWSTKTVDSITVKVTKFSDEMSGISHTEVYIDDKYQGKIESEDGLGEITVTNLSMGYHKVQVRMYDKAGNIGWITWNNNSARTLMYKWDIYSAAIEEKYFEEVIETKPFEEPKPYHKVSGNAKATLRRNTGLFTAPSKVTLFQTDGIDMVAGGTYYVYFDYTMSPADKNYWCSSWGIIKINKVLNGVFYGTIEEHTSKEVIKYKKGTNTRKNCYF